MKNTQVNKDDGAGKSSLIYGDYGFGVWVYNHCTNRAEIRAQVLAHHKIKGWQSCSFAMGVFYAIESKHTKSGCETIFLKECEAARMPLL